MLAISAFVLENPMAVRVVLIVLVVLGSLASPPARADDATAASDTATGETVPAEPAVESEEESAPEPLMKMETCAALRTECKQPGDCCSGGCGPFEEHTEKRCCIAPGGDCKNDQGGCCTACAVLANHDHKCCLPNGRECTEDAQCCGPGGKCVDREEQPGICANPLPNP